MVGRGWVGVGVGVGVGVASWYYLLVWPGIGDHGGLWCDGWVGICGIGLGSG